MLTKNNIDTFLLHLRAYLGSYLSYTGFLWFNYFFMKNYVEIVRLFVYSTTRKNQSNATYIRLVSFDRFVRTFLCFVIHIQVCFGLLWFWPKSKLWWWRPIQQRKVINDSFFTFYYSEEVAAGILYFEGNHGRRCRLVNIWIVKFYRYPYTLSSSQYTM